MMLQTITENRLQKLFYIPDTHTDTRMQLPPELVNELEWEEGQDLYFIAHSNSEFIIRSQPNSKDKFSAGTYKARLEELNDQYFFRLPYNWLVFYQLTDIDLNAFVVDLEEKFLLYVIPKDSEKTVTPVTPL